jgi:hypothetical protein
MTSMRVRVDDSTDRRELVSALAHAGCSVLPIGRTLELVHDNHADDSLELRFFVLAWRRRNPQADLEIIGR